ncbi:MAG: HAD hydrolase family protein [Candidatus Aminicenantes bacterium]|nr:HAD hydrolase family protein [Candidatus Aminicenantes bacterium]
MDNRDRARKIKMILMDVDGTLTDGSLTVLPDGEELKTYHVRDGMGILMAHLVGFKTGIVTGKTSKPLEFRAAKLGVFELYQGALDKKKVFLEIQEKHDLKPEEIAFIGDDLGDLPAMKMAGLAAAVGDAHPRVKEHCHFLCELPGGRGAVREFIEFIFDVQDKWDLIEDKISTLSGVKI